jgi:hypothetical protein
MAGLPIKAEISWGSIMSTATVLVGLAFGWAVMDQRSQQTATAVAALQSKLEQMDLRFRQVEAASPRAAVLERELVELEARMRTAETAAARTEEKTANILTLLERIDARLERIERNGGYEEP